MKLKQAFIATSPVLFRIVIVLSMLTIALFLYWLGGGEFVRCKALSSIIAITLLTSLPIVIVSAINWSNEVIEHKAEKLYDFFYDSIYTSIYSNQKDTV
jgi:hypothetical protein